jgi:hypothetical protein
MRFYYLRVHLRLFHQQGVTLHILDVTPYALSLEPNWHYLRMHLRDPATRSKRSGSGVLPLSWIFRSPLNLMNLPVTR